MGLLTILGHLHQSRAISPAFSFPYQSMVFAEFVLLLRYRSKPPEKQIKTYSQIRVFKSEIPYTAIEGIL